TDVGDATYLGQIAQKLSADEGEEEDEAADNAERRVQRKLTISKELTPLQLKLTKLAELISRIGYVAAALIFVALLARGLWFHEVRWYADKVNPLTGVLDPNGEMETLGHALIATPGALPN